MSKIKEVKRSVLSLLVWQKGGEPVKQACLIYKEEQKWISWLFSGEFRGCEIEFVVVRVWVCGGVVSVGLWRMAGRSMVVVGCGFVEVELWVWDYGGGAIGMWV
nr:hypothetical protein CFP56_27616 [Quercus suber]